MNYFEVKINYNHLDENGNPTRATESYLVDALTFTEAETIINERMQAFTGGRHDVKSITRYPLQEVFLEKPGRFYYKAKLAYLVQEIETKKPKKSKNKHSRFRRQFARSKRQHR